MTGFSFLMGVFSFVSSAPGRRKNIPGDTVQGLCFWLSWAVIAYFVVMVSVSISSWNSTVFVLGSQIFSINSLLKIANDIL